MIRLSQLPLRIRTKIEVLPSDCWHWTAAVNHKDETPVVRYGDEGGKAMVVPARRLIWAMLMGGLSDKDRVTGTCGNPRCVSPLHSQVFNNHGDMLRFHASRGAMSKWPSNTCSRGHLLTEETVYRQEGQGRRCLVCRRDVDRKRYARKKAEKEATQHG